MEESPIRGPRPSFPPMPYAWLDPMAGVFKDPYLICKDLTALSAFTRNYFLLVIPILHRKKFKHQFKKTLFGK